MKKQLSLLIIIAILSQLLSFTVAAKEPFVYKNIEVLGEQHPRVFINSSNINIFMERYKNEKYAALVKETTDTVDRAIAFPPPVYNLNNPDTADGFLRYTVGGNLPNIALLYVLTKDNKYLDALDNWLTVSCNYPFWGRQVGVVNSDLAAGHMLFGVSVAYDWCYDYLKPETKDLVEKTLLSRGADMYAAANSSTTFWKEEWLQNHMWIDMGGLLMAGIVLYNKYPQIVRKWVEQADSMLSKTMILLGDDGASHEGIMYWGYGLEWLLYFIDTARDYLDKDYYKTEWFKKTAYYAIYMGLPLNNLTRDNNHFNIGDDDVNFLIGVGIHFQLGKLASEYKDPYAQYMSRIWFEKSTSPSNKSVWTNILWIDLSVEEKNTNDLPTLKHFDDIDLVSARSDWSGDESALVFKCGPYMGHKVLKENNTNPFVDWGAGHVHPDQNHFSLFGGGDWLLVDDGYSQKYTNSHNSLLIDGRGQLGEGGIWFNALAAQKGGGEPEIKKALSTPDYDYMVGNATGAYSSQFGLKKYERNLLYLKPDVLVVIDDIALQKPRNLELRFFPLTQNAIPQSDGSYYIQNKNTKFLAQPLDTADGNFTFKNVQLVSGRDNINYYPPKYTYDKAVFSATKKTDKWKNIVAFSWSDNNGVPEKVFYKKISETEYELSVSDKVYTIDISDNTVRERTASAVDDKVQKGADAKLAFVSAMGENILDFSSDKFDYEITKKWEDGQQVFVSVPTEIGATVNTVYSKDHVVISVTSEDGNTTNDYIFKIIPYRGQGTIDIDKITATGYNSNQVPALTMDNNYTSYWACDGDEAFIQYEFSKPTPLEYVGLAAFMANTRKMFFKILTSADGESWQEIFNGSDSGKTIDMQYYEAGGKTVKFVKFVGSGNSTNKWNSYAEVAFFDTPKFIRNFKVESSAQSILEGETAKLNVTAVDGSNNLINNPNIIYKIKDPSILSIENNVVTALKKGSTQIDAIIDYEGYQREFVFSLSVYDRTLLSENFETYLPGFNLPPPWKTVTGDPLNQVTAEETQNGISLKVTFTNGGKNPSAIYPLGFVKGNVIIEGDFMCDSMNASKQIQIYDSNNMLCSFLAKFNPYGDISVYDGTKEVPVRTYRTNKWYHLKFVLNIDKQIYDLYINNIRYGKNQAFRIGNANTGYVFDWTKGMQSFRVDTYSPDNETSGFYVDNLKIYIPPKEGE